MRTVVLGGQQDAAWFQARLGVATASKFSKVMAQGKGGQESTERGNYRVRLALERLTGQVEPEDLSYNKDVRAGIEREPIARRLFEVETGLLVDEVSFIKLNDQPVGCSPDGLIDADYGLEIKCPSKAVHFEYLSLKDKPPAVYVGQVQGCMMVTGRSHWYFASFNPLFPPELQLHWFLVKRDEDYISNIIAALAKFNEDVENTVKELQAMIEKRRAAN